MASFSSHNEGEFPLSALRPGRRLGRYELIQLIGEGGMGTVYRAWRIASGEDVAIKFIKSGMLAQPLLRRFHNERRILASLDHPNVARVLDAGTTPEGVPYFVMEYIVGQPIDRYCDSQKLSIEERLRLFLKVCAAVQCAHEIHVIHRDIKPENILVTDAGEPKLLDFGIAKILDPDFMATSQQATATLVRVMTPHYASPEQTRGGPVTPASDVYSLGVLLYELLTGRSPYRTPENTAQAISLAICHERPLPPSRMVSSTVPDAGTLAICANRRTEPSALRTGLAGNIDAILMTALDKDSRLRYESVAKLSDDISHHLEGAVLHSRRIRNRYSQVSARTKWRIGVATAALLAILAVGFVFQGRVRTGVRPSVAVLGFENLSHARSVEWLSTALTEMLSTELSAGGYVRSVPGELISRVKLELSVPNAQTLAPSTLGRLRRSLNTNYVVLGSYLAIGEGERMRVRIDLRLQDTSTGDVVASVSETRSSQDLSALVSRTGTLLRRQLGAGELLDADSGSRRVLPEGAEAARNYAEGLERLRTFDTLAARDLLGKAVAAAPGHALSHSALAAASSLLGYDSEARDEAKKALVLSAGLPREARLSIEGRLFETTRDWDKALATFQTLRDQYPDNIEYGLRLAAAQSKAGKGRAALESIQALRALDSAANDPRLDLAEAEAALAASDLPRARAAARRAAQSGSRQGLRILAAQALLMESRVAIQSGDPQLALAKAAESQQLYLAAGHRQGVAMALNESAGVLNQRGDAAGARARYEEALAVCRTVGDQMCVGTDLDSIGVLRRRQGDLRGALEMHQQALAIRREVGDRSGIATALYNQSNVLEILGDLPRAEKAAAESLEIRKELGERRSSALTMSRLGNIRRRMGKPAEASEMSAQAVAILKAIGDRGGTAMAQANLGQALFDQGELARSRSEFEAALSIRRQQRDKNNSAQVLAELARVALAEDNLCESAGLIAESISLREGLGEMISIAQSKLVLADILLEQGRAAAAEKTAREAAAHFRAAMATGWEGEAELALVRARLARRDVRQAGASLDIAGRLLRGSKDALLLIRRQIDLARLRFEDGRQPETAAILKAAYEQARRSGLRHLELEVRLAMVQAGGAPAAQLASDAREAGFHLIGRKAGHNAL